MKSITPQASCQIGIRIGSILLRLQLQNKSVDKIQPSSSRHNQVTAEGHSLSVSTVAHLYLLTDPDYGSAGLAIIPDGIDQPVKLNLLTKLMENCDMIKLDL